MTVNFPKRRDDQTFSVSATFSFSDEADVSLLRAYIEAWVQANQVWVRIWRSNTIEIEKLEFQSEFFSAPRLIHERESKRFVVVFECRASSAKWKDWVVYLIDEIQKIFPEAKFERFES